MAGLLSRGLRLASSPGLRPSGFLSPATRRLASTSTNPPPDATPDAATLARPAAEAEAMPDFSAAFKGHSTGDLVRAYTVLGLCAFKPLVRRADVLLSVSRRVLGDRITDAAVRHSFFKHFCAGESQEKIRPTVNRLQAAHIGSILDYAVEADMPAGDLEVPEHNQPARHFQYESEASCDENLHIFLECIDAVQNVSPTGFAAIKVTGLGLPRILERMSSAILETQKLFLRMSPDLTAKMSRDDFEQASRLHFGDRVDHALLMDLFDSADKDNDGIDFYEWTAQNSLMDFWKLCKDSEGPLGEHTLTDQETELMANMLKRVERIAKEAAKKKVRLMVDAEQTYFQPAIDCMVVGLQMRYNREFPAIFNTYQCYLKESKDRVDIDMERAKREGYHFAAKLVRGAYMDSERERARQRGYADPIHDTLEDTHANYNLVMRKILKTVVATDRKNSNILIASHNQTTVEQAIAATQEFNIGPTAGVYFGQLLGMADQLTFSLGQSGYLAYKYLPYGPVKEVMPYLLRRAVENSDMLGGAAHERALIGAEIRRRALGG